MRGNSGKYFYPGIILLAYISQIPGSVGLFVLILFLKANKLSAKTSILLVLVSLAPELLWSFLKEGYEFINSSGKPDWPTISIAYLIACGSFYFAAQLLIFIFNKSKEKVLLNSLLGIGVGLLFLTSRMGDNLKGEKAEKFPFPSMGTVCELTVWTNDPEKARSSFLEVKELVDSVEGALSTYKVESEITAMNEQASKAPFKCSDILWENLLLAEYAYNISNGGFDVTIGPLVKLWAIKKRRAELPAKSEIEESLKIVGFDKLVLDKKNKTVFFKEEGLKVDFGGMTKGWAVDKAAALLYKKGFTKFIVNLGGNLYCSLEAVAEKQSYNIGIKDPKYPNKLCAKVGVLGQALATSGNYEQFIIIDNKRYTHIIDPRTGYPVGDVDAVTVLTPSAALSDILSTAIFVEGDKLIPTLEQEIKDLSVLFINIEEKGAGKVIKSGIFKDTEVKLHQ
ncbi:MAG: FAD:protein FMN transferase [Lentisphaeraceae bacterium]|nr:FAD:protein FMN transferase [Lentisphaeraceae bacterium]